MQQTRTAVSWDTARGLAAGLFSASAAIGHLAVGAVALVGWSLRDAARDAASVMWRENDSQRDDGGEVAVPHTLRVVADQFDAAQPFGGLAGATHAIVYNSETAHAQASLAHEFAHVLLAVIRGGLAGDVGVASGPLAGSAAAEAHVEECAAWALARAITRGAIWSSAALKYRGRVLEECGVPAWARAPRIPPPTHALARWLAQV
jgi:hypothetical protein